MHNYDFSPEEKQEFPFSIAYCTQNGFFPEHSHSYTELLIVLNGQGTNVIDNTRAAMQRGTVLTIPPPVAHQSEDMKALESFVLKFDPEKLISYDYELKNDPFFRSLFIYFSSVGYNQTTISPFTLTDEQLQHTAALCNVMLEEYQVKRPGYGVIIRTHLLALMTYLARCVQPDGCETSPQKMQILSTVMYMEDHLSEKIRVSQLAEMAFLSPRQYDRVFKDIYCVTPAEYLQALRLNKACRLMADKSVPLSEIWKFCGFTDNPFFYRQFKKKFGITPKDYRISLQTAIDQGES